MLKTQFIVFVGFFVMQFQLARSFRREKYNVLPPNKEKIRTNCTLFDPIHYRKVEFWSNSLIAWELIEIKKPDIEVYLSFCLPLPDEAFFKCGIKKKFKEYFYIQIDNGVCRSVRF